MMSYEARWPLVLAKKELKNHTYCEDPERSEKLSAEVQEALELALLVLDDFNEAENEAFDVGWQAAVGQMKQIDWASASQLVQEFSPHPYSVKELRAMKPNQWLWVDVFNPDGIPEIKSSYFTVHSNTAGDEIFCCGYPGLNYNLSYSEYGRFWLAYPHKPFPKEGAK